MECYKEFCERLIFYLTMNFKLIVDNLQLTMVVDKQNCQLNYCQLSTLQIW